MARSTSSRVFLRKLIESTSSRVFWITSSQVFSIAVLPWADVVVAYVFAIMQIYFTGAWKLSFTHAAAILNVWGGLCRILPVFCLFLAEAYLGHFMMVVLSSSAYSAGLCLTTLSTPSFLGNSSTTMCELNNCVSLTTKVLVYTGMVLVAIGISGLKASAQPLIDEQTGDDSSPHQISNSCFQLMSLVNLIGAFTLGNMKPGVLSFGIISIIMFIATLIFMSRWSTYVKKKAEGSPITSVCRVYVASVANIFRSLPIDPCQLHMENEEELETRTPTFKFLERAAINTRPEHGVKNRWTLCSVREVEDAKITFRMIPIWVTCIVGGIVYSIGYTYFIEQASHLNRKVGKLELPLQIFALIFLAPSFSTFVEYVANKYEIGSNDKPTVIIASGMLQAILCCITAASIEKLRLSAIRTHGLLDKPDEKIPMTIFWLVIQFAFLGAVELASKYGLVMFYKREAPASLKNYIVLFTEGVFGLGYMCSALSVYVVGKISEMGGKSPNWFQFTLNRSRLDRYYWVLSTLASFNLIFFIFAASRYRYKKPEKQNQAPDESIATPSVLLITRMCGFYSSLFRNQNL